ncbi:MAG: preprotein translocase subunit SecA, partial [Pseudomonadota bacterium]|nr:preprotein translocase subunit SecA [Pseudomonadota bacterium]
MVTKLFSKVFGSRNDRQLKRMQKVVAQINALEQSMVALTDEQLKSKTVEFQQRVSAGATLDSLLPEAFAVVREAGRRVLGMRHYDVQMIGAMVMHEGKIAEMRTGEGKTLVATLAAYLNALSGKGVHVVTVNDYLAQRDAKWMARLYEFLGLTVGVVLSGQDTLAKRAAYAANITYGTNNEFGFDYLRDNMAFRLDDKTQHELNFAIIDEVDSILIDEARTPLVISGPTDDNSDVYTRMNILIPRLTRQDDDDEENPGDYRVDEKAKQVFLRESGHQNIEEMLVEAG